MYVTAPANNTFALAFCIKAALHGAFSLVQCLPVLCRMCQKQARREKKKKKKYHEAVAPPFTVMARHGRLCFVLTMTDGTTFSIEVKSTPVLLYHRSQTSE